MGIAAREGTDIVDMQSSLQYSQIFSIPCGIRCNKRYENLHLSDWLFVVEKQLRNGLSLLYIYIK
jgi:hypothetical protein